jgi:hypothetical protein
MSEKANEADTYPAGEHGPLTNLLDKLSVTPSLLRHGMKGFPDAGLQTIGKSSAGSSPAEFRDTLRHETIHSIFMDAGLNSDNDFDQLMKSSPAGQRLLKNSWPQSGRHGYGPAELPAYIRGDAKYLVGADPKDVAQFGKDVENHLRTTKKNPHAADLYRKMLTE